MTSTLQVVLEKHPFLDGMRPDFVALLTGCAKNRRFNPGDYLMREAEEADLFFLIRSGKVSLQFQGSTSRPLTIQTLGAGDIAGWSWIIAPHRYRLDAVAVEVTQAFEIDGRCIRGKCETNPEFGYEILRRVSAALALRLGHLQLQLIDVYRRSGD